MPGQEQQTARPAPPPGYFDVEATGGSKPPPPPGYHDADAAEQPGTGFMSGLGAGASYLGKQLASPIMHPLDTLNSAMSMASGAMPFQAAKGAYDQYKAARASGSPPVSSAAEAIGQAGGLPAQEIRERAQRGDVGGVIGEGVPSVVAALLGGRTAEKGLPDVGGGVRETIGKYSGISDLQSNIAKRGQLAADAVNSAKTAENAAHTEASAPYKAIAEKVKETIPTQQFRSETGDIANLIEGEKVPGAIKDITQVGDVKRSTGPPVGGRHFDLSDPNDLKAFQMMKAQGVFSPAEIARMEGSAEGIGFEQLKQMRSRLGREMDSYDGAAAKAGPQLYDYLSQQLRGLVDRAGVLGDYKNAETGYKKFMDDWHNGHPIKNLLFGKDTNKIIDSFRGDSGKRVTDTLRNYGADLTPFQELHKAKLIDEPFKNAEADSNILSEKAMSKERLKNVSQQGVMRAVKSPWTLGGLAVGIANPTYMPLALAHAGLRLGLPRLLGTDFIGDWLTKGMSEDLPKIPPKKVLPKPPEK